MKASPSKLRDGSWGARCIGTPVPRGGDRITVTRRDGSTRVETVGRILWSGPDRETGETVTLVSTGLNAAPASSARSTSRGRSGSGRCRECHGPIVDAAHHRAMGGLCGSCAFDEYDC